MQSSHQAHLTMRPLMHCCSVLGPEQGPHPRKDRESPSGGDVPLGAGLSPQPGPHVPASTAAAAAGKVPGCTAGSGSLPGVPQ